MDFNSIAESLADSEASTRSEGFARMRSYVSSNFPLDQLVKVWKSLFCYLWMTDKSYEETVEEISSLYESFKKGHILWFTCFIEMMRNEWEGIDSARLDKFKLLVRFMLRGVLPTVINNTKDWVCILTETIEYCIYQSQSFLFHLIDIFIDELPPCPFSTKRKLIKPFITLMKSCTQNNLIDHIYNKILLKLIESKEPGLEEWLFTLATSKVKIQDKSRERFYDAYSLILEGSLPNRQDLGCNEGPSEPETRKKKKKNSQPEGIPEALQKVMNEFYQQPIENEIEALSIGKDVIELKHEHDSGTLHKKKKKKSKRTQEAYDKLGNNLIVKTQESEESIGNKRKGSFKDKNLRKVNFNLKLNSTRFFDTKNIVSQCKGGNLKVPGKGILKTKSQNRFKPVKKQKTK